MATALWQSCLDQLQEELPEQQFNTWIRPLRVEDKQQLNNEGPLRLLAPNRFIEDWVNDKFLGRIEEIYQQLNGTRCEIFVSSQNSAKPDFVRRIPAEKPAPQHTPTTQVATAPRVVPLVKPKQEIQREVEGGLRHESNLNGTFVFDAFVEGKSNQLALAAARQVAENPGGSYNPDRNAKTLKY